MLKPHMPNGLARPKSISLAPDLVSMMFAGLQVAMNNARAMCDLQGLGYFAAHFQRFVQRQRALAQSLGDRLAFEELHHQVIGSVLRTDVIKLANVGMVQRRNGARLALHPLF